jgi:ketosteroid isomerase-like protein
MSERDDFLAWFDTDWRAAEIALHGGDPGPRFDTWSDREPVTLFGAWLDAHGPEAVRALFTRLGDTFSKPASSDVDLIAAEVSGDFAYTVHREMTSTTVDGQPRDYVLRVTQVYRREAGAWKVVHRHADEQDDASTGP